MLVENLQTIKKIVFIDTQGSKSNKKSRRTSISRSLKKQELSNLNS